jgi:hypothetical protein
MVIALLLSDANKPLRYKDLGRVALQCLHGVHSMWKALSILQSVIPCGGLETPSTTSSTLPSRLLSAFDAHVGDCACPTRAQMLWELVQFYNIPEKKDALKRAVTMLQEIRIQAALLLQEIEQSYGKPRTPGLDALQTHLSVWQRIGFTRFLDLFYGRSDSPSGTSVPQTTAAGDVLASKCILSVGRIDHNLLNALFLGPPPPPNSSHKCCQIRVETEWDVDNLFFIARFLTLCLLLSECKIAKIESGPPIRVTVRVDLQWMYAEIGRELEALNLLPAQRDAKRCNGTVKMNAQCDAMQGYISIITTDWVRKTVLRLGLFDLHQRYVILKWFK